MIMGRDKIPEAPVGLAAEVEQPLWPNLLIAVHPSVTGGPRDSELTAKIRQ